MFGFPELKEKINITATKVECPVKNCIEKVERQKQHFRKDKIYQCPVHKIYISPSTFEYETEEENLLWVDNSDIDLFQKIKKVKRESRIVRENSEDAVTWNVFRFLEKNNLLPGILSTLSGLQHNTSELILWSYSKQQTNSWDLLNSARKEFGEQLNRGSEPDVIVCCGNALFFIENKVLSGNDTSGSGEILERHLNEPKKYISGGNNWYSNIFNNDYKTVIADQKYELLRFWLLGSWIANQLNVPFFLVNLVLKDREKEIEKEFGKHIIQNQNRTFKRICWENVYEFIVNTGLSNNDTTALKQFFKNKTLGYDSKGNIIKAFDL